jgi:hypothetical protein
VKSDWFHRRILKRFSFLHKHGTYPPCLLLTYIHHHSQGWRLLLYCRCFLRRKAVALVRTFFVDFATFRLPYIMMKYRTNAVHLQRFVRSYVLITQVTTLAPTSLCSSLLICPASPALPASVGSHRSAACEVAAAGDKHESDTHANAPPRC